MEISSQYFELEDCMNDDNCYWIKPDNTPAETETVVVGAAYLVVTIK